VFLAALFVALGALAVHSSHSAFSCRHEGVACAESASETIGYLGRFFTGTGRPVTGTAYDVLLPSRRDGGDLNPVTLRTDARGRFCFRAPVETVRLAVRVHALRPAGPVDTRFPKALLDRIVATSSGGPPPPIVVVPEGRGDFMSAESWRGSTDALKLYRDEDRIRSCSTIRERAPWWRYRDKSGDWRAWAPYLMGIAAAALTLAELLGRSAGDATDQGRAAGWIGSGLALATAIVVGFVG
jgi:hypothetical protein